MRRLLPPLWLFSAAALCLLFAGGWNPAPVFSRQPLWSHESCSITRLLGYSSTAETGLVFGKNRQVSDPPVPSVPWADVWEFAIGNEERPAGGQRKSPVLGLRAIRVPHGSGAQRVLAPCAYVPPEAPSASAPDAALRLYEDAEGRQLLCSLDSPEDVKGERRYPVRCGQGELIGTIRRISPLKHALKPTWRIEQPGHPEITNSAEWAKGGPKEIVQRGTGKLLLGALQAVADMGADGGDQPAKSRVLEWKADGELVMTSEGHHRFLIRAAWLDRRLAFAYALLRDS
ncbi:hypothetical protein [Streptomyces flavofungini]|uniref:hypothetical protein n=1 Tax=Streptomyces flavofungini TaxID=68200 RepID=UPI0025B1E390|nr:hypothetical protein [Streptomyces flavofungini]WJV48393.1 hypothetical protein QUY26_24460 [Streptomyces flavofungini]